MGGTDVTITIDIDAYLADRLRVLGDARRRSWESLVYEALERFLDEEEGYERRKEDEAAYHRGDLDFGDRDSRP
jgi:predicted transcriptional regulator